MAKVRVPVYGSVGKSVRVDQDATKGATLGVNLYDSNGNVLDIDALAALLASEVQEINIEDGGTVNPTIFETDIVDGTLLARVGDPETITGPWTYSALQTFNADVVFNDDVTVNLTGAEAFAVAGTGTGNITFSQSGAGEIQFQSDVNFVSAADLLMGVNSVVQLDDGSAAAPSLAFTSATTTGFYEAGGSIGVTLGGTLLGQFSPGYMRSYQQLWASEGVIASSTVADLGQVGIFAFIDVAGGEARFGGYNYDLASWQPTVVRGSTLELDANATGAAVTANRFAIENVDARFYIKDTDAAVDEKDWLIQSTNGTLRFYSANDARASFDQFLQIDRTANVVDQATWDTRVQFNDGIDFGSVVAASTVNLADHIDLYAGNYGVNITAGSMNFVANATNNFSVTSTTVDSKAVHYFVGGSAGAPGLAFSAETNTGFYRPAAGDLGISIQGTQRVLLDGEHMRLPFGGARYQAGNQSGGYSGTFGSRQNTDAAGLQYGTYWSYDSYWDEAADNWVANRTSLGRKWLVEMGYHLDEFKVRRYDGVVTSPWADSAWSDLFAIDNVGNVTLLGTVDGRDVAADGTKLDGIESGATADQTAGEIEAIVNHDNLLGFVANEHIDWTVDQGGTQINVNNLSPDRHGLTPASNFVEFNRFGASFDMDTLREPGQYGAGSATVNGPSGLTFDPLLVMASSSDVTSQLVVPRTASRALAYRGETSDVFTAWHYAAWTTTAADADLSLYAKTSAVAGIPTLDDVVTNGDIINAGVGLVELELPAGGQNISWRTDVSVGGWARGMEHVRKSDSARQGGFGFLGTAEAITSFHVGFGSSWWSTNSTLDLTTALFTVGNYSFDIDQTVGAGQDNYVLTYDNASGLISLEAAGAGSGIGGTIANDQVAFGAATADEIEGSANLTFDGTTLTISGVMALSGNTLDLLSGTYFNVKGNSDSAGGVRLYDNTGNIRGYYYYNATHSGLLHSGGGWAMQIAHGTTTVTFPGNVNVNTGLDVTGNLTVEGDSTNVVRAVDYNNTGYDHWNWYNTAAVTAGTWYTIATDPVGLDITTTPVGKTGASRSAARIRVWDNDSGQHSFCEFEVSVNYGRRPTVTLINRSSYGSGLTGVRGIRVVRYSTYNGHAIQILAGHTGTMYYTMQELGVSGGFKGRDWLAQTPEANWHIEEIDFADYNSDMRFMVATGPAVGADDAMDGIGVADGRFYPALDGGNVGTEMGYFSQVTATYGSVNVAGCSGSGGTWAGYHIENEYVLMSYAGAGRVGIYNDVDNEWMMQWYRNGAVIGYHNGASVFTTLTNGLSIHQANDSTTDKIDIYHDGTNAHMDIGSAVEFFVTGPGIMLDNDSPLWSRNFADTASWSLIRMNSNDDIRVGGTTGSGVVELCEDSLVVARTQNHNTEGHSGGLEVYDHSGTWRDVGFADSEESRTNTSFTMGAEDIGNVAHYTNGSNYNATLAASTNLDFPVGCRMDIINRAAGTININQGTGTTLYWDDGSGTAFTTGNRDLGYGWATIWRQSATVYYVTGSGIT